MNKSQYKYIKISMYVFCLFIIILIINSFFLPVVQYHSFKKTISNNHDDKIYSSFAWKIDTSEKEFIVIHDLYLTTKRYEENPVLNSEVFMNSIKFTEDYISKKNIFINPVVYIGLSYSYLLKYQQEGDLDLLNKSYYYTNKALSESPKRQYFLYSNALSKIDLGFTKEGLEEINNIEKNDSSMKSYYLGLGYYYNKQNELALINLENFFSYKETYKSIRSKKEIVNIYYKMMQYFYESKDKENFLIVINRLRGLEDNNKDFFDYLISYISKENKLPNIKLKY